MSRLPAALTFDALLEADLEQVYQRGKDEVLRSRAFKILLDFANSVPKLVKIAFESEGGLARWTTNELFEISNRFRLMSSPENEIRLYRECVDPAFQASPRVREFLVLALNKSGQPAEAIREASRILADGGQNVLIWGALAQSYTGCVLYAEQLLRSLASAPAKIDPAQFVAHFPDVALAELTPALAEQLRARSMAAAMRTCRQGFRDTGEPYPGLGWMARIIDQLAETAHAHPDADMARLHHDLRRLTRLLRIALDVQGGRESRDYWTHAGLLQLAIVQHIDEAEYQATLRLTLTHADAGFKLSSTRVEIERIRDGYAVMSAIRPGDPGYAARVERAEHAIAALERGRAQFAQQGRAATGEVPAPADPVEAFLSQTINFGALAGNMVPLTLSGTIGRVGARVPDLLINRRVQEDLADLINHNILPTLQSSERTDPRAVAQRILQMVGTLLNIGALQDLQSPGHFVFDTRSDGLIALSGVDADLRKDSRTGTDLTAAMLLQNCDCRETMYLNGALFARWQQTAVRNAIARALLCMDVDFDEGFERIVGEEIPALMRYQLRGGQVDVYVESIAMLSKYKHVRRSADDATAMARPYGLAELRAGQPLTRYELEQSLIEVRHADGAVRWLQPRDPASGAWRPIPHTPVGDGGVPLIDGDVAGLRLLNLVEAHALTFLYDTQARAVELCDGFYNERLFDNCPYTFGSGSVDVSGLARAPGLLQAGTRTVIEADGAAVRRPVYLSFLRYSQADYAIGLVEGDMPETLQLMGRTFRASFRREQRRLQEGTSPVPALLEKIQAWQLSRDAAQQERRTTLDRRLTRLMLDLAKAHPELAQLRETSAHAPLIREDQRNDTVYLVLSGRLVISRNGAPLHGEDGSPVTAIAGNIVGQISALRDTTATATVRGDAVVLGMSKEAICCQLGSQQALQQLMDELSAYHYATLQANGYTAW
jgi:hypothetical protein